MWIVLRQRFCNWICSKLLVGFLSVRIVDRPVSASESGTSDLCGFAFAGFLTFLTSRFHLIVAKLICKKNELSYSIKAGTILNKFASERETSYEALDSCVVYFINLFDKDLFQRLSCKFSERGLWRQFTRVEREYRTKKVGTSYVSRYSRPGVEGEFGKIRVILKPWLFYAMFRITPRTW